MTWKTNSPPTLRDRQTYVHTQTNRKKTNKYTLEMIRWWSTWCRWVIVATWHGPFLFVFPLGNTNINTGSNSCADLSKDRLCVIFFAFTEYTGWTAVIHGVISFSRSKQTGRSAKKARYCCVQILHLIGFETGTAEARCRPCSFYFK